MDSDIEIYKAYQKDPFLWIKDMYWLVPQIKWQEFIKWKHISWQQAEIVQAVKDAINWKSSRQISIKSWHSIWKSVILSYIILWFMFCFKCKIWLTAPDSQLLFDVLWSEVWSQLSKLPEDIKNLFEKTSDHLYLKEDKAWWFARCKTGKKENPEALAWLHSDNIMLIWDEASWIPEQIFEAWASNLTGHNYLYILIWNPLRNVWYFYNTFKNKDWNNLSFSSLDSPFKWDYPEKVASQYWINSDEYNRRVIWDFPREDILDDKWYVQLIMEKDIKYIYQDENLYWNRKILWVDCAWQWKDKSTWVIRDNTKSVIVWYEEVSDPKSIANKTLTLMREYNIEGKDIIIDNFWAWANVAKELALLWIDTTPIYVWENIEEEWNWQKFKNLRAKLYRLSKQWIESGWLLSYRDYWKELLTIRYKRTLRDEIQIMSKEDMKKAWYNSPDFADAFSMTFYYDLNNLANYNIPDILVQEYDI